MIKSARYLFVVVFAGISFFFVGAVSAISDFTIIKSGTPVDKQSTEVDQKGGEVDFSWGVSDGELDRSKQPGVTLESGDNFRPGAADTPQQRKLPRGQREGGLVYDFEEVLEPVPDYGRPR